MKIEIKNLTFGNFDYDLVADVADKDIPAVLRAGITQTVQRVPSSRAERKLAGYDKRPEGFKRNSIVFNDDNAMTLSDAIGGPADVEKGVSVVLVVTDVREHVVTEADSKFTEEREIVARHRTAGDFDDWAKAKVKFSGDVGTTAEPSIELLRAVRTLKLAILRERAASI